MDKYEISLWEDYPDLTSNNVPFLNERKLCVIGSNTMTSAARAMEPKLVSNVNGTNTFSFRIYYRYNDEITGEEYINPYLPYIINERKVKVLWKNKWYDLVIKKIEEDTQKHSVLCTCEDLFISELSKNGYELEFNSELQNNSGTAEELTARVLYGSGWQPAENQQSIIQYQEEPVYEVYTQSSITVTKQSPNGNTSVTIPANRLCLLYQSCTDETCTNIQFLYSANDYITEDNGMLVLNGDCYSFNGHISYNGSQVRIVDNSYRSIFVFSIDDAFSSRYRANRLVGAQLTVFDNLLNRYVDVYENNIYGYETTEYSDPTLVVNLIANPKDFKDTQGWIGRDLQWQVYPSFTGQGGQTVANYNAKSYLKITSGNTYNTAFVSNKQYLNPNQTDIRNGKLGGFQVGEKYVFRYKAKSSLSSNSYITSGITCQVYKFNIDSSGNYNPTGSSYFSDSSATVNDDWAEIILTCSKACAANELSSVGLFIYSNSTYYIEDIQFFKLAYGTDIETSSSKRINPGEFSAQSIVKTVYRYYNADHDGVTDAKDLKFLYSGEIKQDGYIPVYNNYEKITSIEISKSNRFNILQTIAEKFECWVRFIINHNQETGQILYDSQGLPQKYVQLVEQIGHDTGISFEYGIDLKGIKRTIVSNTIATKAIIPPNQNEFGKNGFCTIARSTLNYCRENFILNFDYYIQQGLLNKNLLEADLYKTNGTNLGYYFYLNKFNREYDELANNVNARQVELTKQQAAYTVQASNLRASREKLGDNKSDLATLAGVDNFADAQSYASTHADNRKVQSLMGSIAKLNNSINELAISTNSLEASINALKSDIQIRNDRMAVLIQNINNLHRAFFRKYSRFIQEGTWQDQNYFDDDKYYLDGLEVAYRSSRPQIQYDISLLRLSGLEDFSSKVFDLGDICYIQDKEFFGYEEDGITPYKQKIIISQLTSYFDTPEKDLIKVQNYSTQFDDLFQRITTATQALEFSQGKYERAAEVVKPDKTLSFALLQDTFDYNKDLILNSANQEVTWDNTGITVSDTTNSALKVKIMAGGIFASDDGGDTWKNALRGDGISTDLLTAGRINTSEIYVYDGNSPSFRWDSLGINAYTVEKIVDPDTGLVNDEFNFNKFVRFDKFGLYGYDGTEDFEPSTEDAIWNSNKTKFGLTWKGFFLRNTSGNSSIEISNQNDILIKTGGTNRIQIGKYDNDYGMRIRDASGGEVFSVSTTSNTNSIGGWTLTSDSFYHTANSNTIGLYSSGNPSTVNGINDTYYILAGNNFGVTIDGGVYASKGKIADCEIVNGKLTIGSSRSKLEDTIMSSSSVTEYRLSNSDVELSGDYDWSTSIPTWSEDKYIWTRIKTIITKASNPQQEIITYRPNENGVYSESLSQISYANTRQQTIYRSTSGGSIPSTPTDWVADMTGAQNIWTNVRPEYSQTYPVLYIATQSESMNGVITCTTPKIDATTTVIDGAHIITGTIDANKIAVQDLSAFNATIGGFTISDTAIYSNGKSSYFSTNSGVYIGSDGISLGSNFKVDSNGNLYANTGTFSGNIYAGNIRYGGNYGTFDGAGITNYSIPGGTAIAAGSIGTGPLSSGVNNSLGYANSYNAATVQNTSNYPAYFTAGSIYGISSVASKSFSVENSSGDEIYNLVGHFHSLSESNGRIVLGIPHNNSAIEYHSFNIADTATYKNAVSAAHNEAKANYISFVPTSPSSWNQIIATPGEVKTSGSHKYIQAQFNLTAGHQNSGSSSTSYDFSSNNRIFNVDVTDIAGSSYTNQEKYITSNGNYIPASNIRWSKVRVDVPQQDIGVPSFGTITENGTYYASDDSLDGFSSVTVNVPTGGGGIGELDVDRVYNEYTSEVEGPYYFQGSKYVDVRIFNDSSVVTTKKLWVGDWPDDGGGGAYVTDVVNYAGDLHTGPYGSKELDLTTRVYYSDGGYADFSSSVTFYE